MKIKETKNPQKHDVVFELKNKPDYIKYCTITQFSDGKILLNWRGHAFGGEDGFFLSMRAAKKYVSESICGSKSLWTEELDPIT